VIDEEFQRLLSGEVDAQGALDSPRRSVATR
jgi:hypothetical protein